jgi:hypothetical protein
MNRCCSFFLLLLLLTQCQTLQDADPVERKTFLRFYERVNDYTGKTTAVLSDGYLIAADLAKENGSSDIVITKTDQQGNIVWENSELKDATVQSILTLSDGYLIFGARIEIDPTAQQVTDLIKNKTLLAKITSDGTLSASRVFENSENLKTDLSGDALTQDKNGLIYGVGSMIVPGERTRAFTIGINPTSLDTLWYEDYSLIDRDYINARSAFITSEGKLLWGSSAKTTQLNKSYLYIPVVTPNSTFVNDHPFGALDDRYYSGEDVCQSAVGYAAIGTYYSTSSQNSKMYFVRTDVAGNFVEGSDLYFDAAITKILLESTEKDATGTQCTGNAISATADGGYLLAGSMVTTTETGNGGTDIFLVRLDAFGKMMWHKIIGGTGNEIVSSVRTTSDGGFIIGGSSTIGGLSSVYLLKINRSGELKD